MATVKQLNMLSAKARAAGMEFDRTASKDLTNGDIDALVEKFDKGAAKQEQPTGTYIGPVAEKINYVRLGIAQKLVVQEHGEHKCRNEPVWFQKTVKELYELFGEVEEAITASSSGD